MEHILNHYVRSNACRDKCGNLDYGDKERFFGASQVDDLSQLSKDVVLLRFCGCPYDFVPDRIEKRYGMAYKIEYHFVESGLTEDTDSGRKYIYSAFCRDCRDNQSPFPSQCPSFEETVFIDEAGGDIPYDLCPRVIFDQFYRGERYYEVDQWNCILCRCKLYTREVVLEDCSDVETVYDPMLEYEDFERINNTTPVPTFRVCDSPTEFDQNELEYLVTLDDNNVSDDCYSEPDDDEWRYMKYNGYF